MDVSLIQEAVRVLRKGGLVAFPTETVYGLGADADNPKAVQAVFRVKGRPQNHPLIVHLGQKGQMGEWGIEIPEGAQRLADRFWPGPLTLVVKKASRVLGIVTGGQETVALRVPGHPVALKLLREFGGGLAAPSANRFGKVSPTTADHVRQDLGCEVDFILDGGPCEVGVESTIVDFSSAAPAILRPGGVTREQLEAALGIPVPVVSGGDVRVSGQLESHYAPRARVMVVVPEEAAARAETIRREGKRTVLLSLDDVSAQKVYASLRRADESGAEVIVVPLPADEGLGLAVADRLRKAAGPR